MRRVAQRLGPNRTLFLRVGGATTILLALFLVIDWSSLSVTLSRRTFGGLILAVIGLLLGQILAAARWRLVLPERSATMLVAIRLYLIGLFVSLFLPTAVGGDLVRGAAAAKLRCGPVVAMASVLLDRVLGMCVILLFFVIGLIMWGLEGTVPELGIYLPGGRQWWLGLLVVLVLIGIGFSAVRRFAMVRNAIRQLWSFLAGFRHRPGQILFAFLLALLVQAAYFAVWIVLAVSLDFRIPITFFLLAVPLVTLASMIPLTISGLGLREGTWIILLDSFGVSAADATAYGLLYFTALAMVGLVGGGAMVLMPEIMHRRMSGGLEEGQDVNRSMNQSTHSQGRQSWTWYNY